MTTIKEDYVSFETAKLLKKKEFNIACEYQYINCSSGCPFLTDIRDDAECYYKNTEIGQDEYSAPTLQMAMKWLREVHSLCVYSIPLVTDSDGSASCLWGYVISKRLETLHKSECLFEEPEQACGEAIKYCLENLI